MITERCVAADSNSAESQAMSETGKLSYIATQHKVDTYEI